MKTCEECEKPIEASEVVCAACSAWIDQVESAYNEMNDCQD